MSDVMEQAVLLMPPELWTNDAIDVRQRHARYVQAAKDLETLRKEKENLVDLIEWLLSKPYCTCHPRSDEWHYGYNTCSCGFDKKMQQVLEVVAKKHTGD